MLNDRLIAATADLEIAAEGDGGYVPCLAVKVLRVGKQRDETVGNLRVRHESSGDNTSVYQLDPRTHPGSSLVFELSVGIVVKGFERCGTGSGRTVSPWIAKSGVESGR